MDHQRFTIVGIGEALFDIFPDGQRLGGAPLNAAVHAHQLARVRHGQGVLVSRIGQDAQGQLLLEELQRHGLTTHYVQTDPDRPTGRVYVDFDEHGHPSYDIVDNVAWDVIQFDPDIEDLALACTGVCFGTLAQRDAQTRNTIFRFLDTARHAARLFDVNLRQHHYDARALRRSCEAATILKLNEEEIPVVASSLGPDPGAGIDDPLQANDHRAEHLRKQFKLDMIVLTHGQRGTRIYTKDGHVDGEPANYPPADDADPVGAGDAASAAILVGKALRFPPQKLADLANHAGAYVASQPGATPELPDTLLAMLKP